jgi:hypothetical protein
MPEVSRFYGIVVRIFYDDHNPPHFHAEYGEHEVLVNINTLAFLGGSLPARALGLVTEWASLHQQALRAAWERASRLQSPGKNRALAVNAHRGRITTQCTGPALALLAPAGDRGR